MTDAETRGLDDRREYYDKWTMTDKPHILDALAEFQPEESQSDEAMSVAYQFTCACSLLQRFEVRAKPLKLFSHQERNSFFQSEPSSSAAGIFFGANQDFTLVKTRRSFVELCALGVASTVQHDGAPENLDLADYKRYTAPLTMLGKTWFMADWVRAALAEALFKRGHDHLGREVWCLVTADRRRVARELIDVAFARLAKFLQGHPKQAKLSVHALPNVMAKMERAAVYGKDYTEVSLATTIRLVEWVCEESLDEVDERMAIDALSLAQTFYSKEQILEAAEKKK